MTIAFSEFFDLLGVIVLGMRRLNGQRGSTAPNPSNSLWGSAIDAPYIGDSGTIFSDLVGEFDGSAFEDVIESWATVQAAYEAAQKGTLTSLQAMARTLLLRVVNADSPQLSSSSISQAMTELCRQMVAGSESVNASTVSVATTTGSSNTGAGVAFCTVKDRYGRTAELSFNETLVAVCSSDKGTGGTQSRETFGLAGAAAETDTLSQDWPAGSGASGTLTALDAASTSSNLLTDGAFSSWTTNTPASWTIAVGVAGTDVFAAGSSAALGSTGNALQLTGTGGGPLSELTQTLTSLKPNTVYFGSVWLKKTTSLAAGVLTLSLYDGSSTIADDQSTANSKAITLSGLTTSYACTPFFFITPKQLPTTVKFRVKATTALTSGESLYVDHLCFAAATQLYTAGPFAGIASSPVTDFVVGDRFSFAVSSTLGVFQEYCERIYGMRALGLQLPSNSSGSETEPDSLCAHT